MTFTTDLGSFPTEPYVSTTVNGVAVAVLTSSTQAGTSIITARCGATTSTVGLTLIPGTPFTLTLSAAPSQTSVGAKVVITTTVTDRHGNFVIDGTPVTFTTDLDLGSGGFSPEVGLTADGMLTSILTSTRTGSGVLTATTSGSVNDTLVITFTPGSLEAFGLGGYPASTMAGLGFSSDVVVTAYDVYGNVKDDYTGSVYFGSTDPRATLPFTSEHTFQFTVADAGQHAFAGGGFVLRTTSGQFISVTNGALVQISDYITVTPAALGSLQITASPEVTAGIPFSIIVHAYDVEGNLKTDYSGLVTLHSTDDLATMPIDDGSGWGNGANVISLVLYTSGSQVLTITHGAVMQSVLLNVSPGPAAALVLEDTADGDGAVISDRTVTAGGTLTMYAIARDNIGSFVGNVEVAWTLIGQSGGIVDGDLVPSGDSRSATLSGRGAGTAIVRAVYEGPPLTATIAITVESGPPSSFLIQVPVYGTVGQPFTATISALDQFSNTATGFAADVLLSTTNGGVITPSLITGTAFQNGVWTGQLTLSVIGTSREIRAESGSVSGTATIDILEERPFKVYLPLVLRGGP